MSGVRDLRWRVLSVVAICLAMTAIGLVTTAPAQALMQAGTGPFLWQNPVPQGDDLNQVVFASPTVGYAVGRTGTILTTSDDGATWSPEHSGTAANLMGVSFCDAAHGWAVGNNANFSSAVLVSTSDGGTSWTVAKLPMAIIVNAVTFTDASHGWIAGEDLSQRYGLLYATSDAGATWHLQHKTGADQVLMGIQFTSAKRGWAVGGSDVILSTTDGGSTWRIVHSGGTECLRGLSFSDPTHGWAVGQATVLATTDGGTTWQAQAPVLADDRYVLDSVAFASDQVGWLVGEDQWTGLGFVYGTTDGGADWQPQGSNAADWLNGVTCTDTSHAFAVGNTGIMRMTTDGSDWTDLTPGTFDDFYGVAFADQTHGWAVGERIGTITPDYPASGRVIGTTDGGASWTPQLSVSGEAINGVACADANSAWAVGNGGGIYATNDGGADWNPQTSGTTDNLFAVSFADANDGWAVGEQSTILVTTDGGMDWAAQTYTPPSGYNAVLYSVKAIDALHACAVGALYGTSTESGMILTTTDGGQDWTTALTPAKDTFHGVTFVNSQDGWAVGANTTSDGGGALIMATTDGGATWFSQTPKLSGEILSVAFADTQHGWATSADGVIHATLDGGAHWGTLNSGTDNLLFGVALADRTHGWVVGQSAAILASDPSADLTPPDLTTGGPGDGTWTNSPATVTMNASETAGSLSQQRDATRGLGSSVALRIEIIKDGVKKIVDARTARATIAAPANHAGDGVHAVTCWSIDPAGNCSPKNVIDVTVDTRRPTVTAYPTSAHRGGTTALKFKVSHTKLAGDYARLVTITVVNPKGKVVQTIKLRRVSLNRLLTTRFAVPSWWHRGTYHFLVRAVDRAGNPQAAVAVSRLLLS